MSWIIIIREVVLTIAAACGAYAAVFGLSTWRKQLKGKTEYELARKLLVNTFKLRDSIERIRHGVVVRVADMPPATPDNTTASRFYDSLSSAYNERWEGISSLYHELSADLVEAEAIWGTDIRDRFKSLLALYSELAVFLGYYLQSHDPDVRSEHRDAYRLTIREKLRPILFELGRSKDDAYGADLTDAVRMIELALKRHLRK